MLSPYRGISHKKQNSSKSHYFFKHFFSLYGFVFGGKNMKNSDYNKKKVKKVKKKKSK